MVGPQVKCGSTSAAACLKTSYWFCPPKYGEGCDSAGRSWPVVAAGKMPCVLINEVSASGLVLSQRANFAASAGCFAPLNTAAVEPPQLPADLAPAVHCGIGATAHLPAVFLTLVWNRPAVQTAAIPVHSCPESSALYHCSPSPGRLVTSFSSTIFCQYLATCSDLSLVSW